MNADEIEKAKEIVRALRDYASDCDDCCDCFRCDFACVCGKFDYNAPKIIADLIESLTAQLTESQRKERADAELIRKIYFATDEDLCDCCRKIVRMIEAWWNDDEKGEAE